MQLVLHRAELYKNENTKIYHHKLNYISTGQNFNDNNL